MPLTVKPGGGWHRLLARIAGGEPATIHTLDKEARGADTGDSRRVRARKLHAATTGLLALGLVEKVGPWFHPTQAGEAALADLVAAAQPKEDA